MGKRLEQRITAERIQQAINAGNNRTTGTIIKAIADKIFPGYKHGPERVKRFLRMPDIIKAVDNGITQYYVNAGLGKDRAIEMMLETYEIAKEKKDAATMLKISQYLMEVHKIAPDKVSKSLQLHGKVDASAYPSPGDVNNEVRQLSSYQTGAGKGDNGNDSDSADVTEAEVI